MSGEESQIDVARLGRVEVVPSEHPRSRHPEIVEESTCRWIPGEAIRREVPPGFVLELDCSVTADGRRFFAPRGGAQDLVVRGSLGGLAILNALQQLDAETRNSYRVMFLIFRLVRGMREHLMRDFQYSRDLYIRQTGRESDRERDVLPPDLGLTADGQGRPWNISELTQRGEESARAAGNDQPDQSEKIQRGMLEAAKRNPLVVVESETEGLVRCALFAGGPIDVEMSVEHEAEIERRVLEAIGPHLKDTTEDFDAWLYGAKNSFLKQIAKQRRSPHGELPRAAVRKFLLDLGWRAYGSMANCLEAQMWAFFRALPEPLEGQNRKIFELVYFRQKALGNLPLTMLSERMPMLKYALLEWWAAPDDHDIVGVIHRLLDYYAWMADQRRPADRRAQSVSKSRQSTGRGLMSYEFTEELAYERGYRRRGRDPGADSD